MWTPVQVLSERPAICIRQPYVQQILEGAKTYEYRTTRTHKRGTVYVYASKTCEPKTKWGSTVKNDLFVTGVVVGTVDITDCVWFPERGERGEFGYKLENPVRFAEPLVPNVGQKPQPIWFYPFGPFGQ